LKANKVFINTGRDVIIKQCVTDQRIRDSAAVTERWATLAVNNV